VIDNRHSESDKVRLALRRSGPVVSDGDLSTLTHKSRHLLRAYQLALTGLFGGHSFARCLMGIDNAIKIAVVLVAIAAATGNLPRFTMAIRRGQIQLLHESRASHWGTPALLERPN
jgi:hypothetical protein